jgi:hypothetical protein
MSTDRSLLRWLLAPLAALALAACGEPIVARGPEALYALARQQLESGQYRAAADTLARVAKEAPESEPGRRAQVLRVALLGAMARAYRQIGEAYLTGSQPPGVETGLLRAAGIDQLGRARDRSLEMSDAVEALLNQKAVGPWAVEAALLDAPQAETAKIEVREWRALEEAKGNEAERALVRRGLAELAAQLAGAETAAHAYAGVAEGELKVEPAAFYLGAARELVATTPMYRREALDEPRMIRFYHERALAAAERARELAQAAGDSHRVRDAEAAVGEWRRVLGKK